MINIPEQYFRLVPDAARKHLLSSLQSLTNEQPPTPSFKLYGRCDWSVVEDFLRSKEVSATAPPSWLLDYEFSRKEKFGPQGGHAPWKDLKENAEMYFSRVKDVGIILPDEEVLSKYSSLSLNMLSPRDALQKMQYEGKVQERANGWRLFNLKKTDPRAQEDALYLLKSGLWREGYGYFFSRFNKQKKRLFVPMPFSANIYQAQWTLPFLESIQKSLRDASYSSPFVFMADKIGFRPLFKDIIPHLCRGLNPKHFVYVMRDFEKMDTTMGASQKRCSLLPRLKAAYHYSDDTYHASEIDEVMTFSNTCPIATPDGMWTGPHGEASGATVTNLGETCSNEDYDYQMHKRIMINSSKSNIVCRRICSFGNGDDGFSIYYLENLEKFDQFSEIIREAATTAADMFGFRIQADKWDIYLGTYGKYCQYLTYVDASGTGYMYYPASLILNSIMNPESMYKPSDWDKDYKDLDIISKLNNGFDLPYFTELVDYVDKGLKFPLLGRDERETSRILSKWDRYLALQPGSREFNVTNYDWEENPWASPVVEYILQKRRQSR